jgi:hypothetical protein
MWIDVAARISAPVSQRRQTTENPLVSINADSGATSSQISPAGA